MKDKHFNYAIVFQSTELRLIDGSYQVVRRDAGEEIPYQMRTMGLYLVIEASNGLTLIWDRKTTIHIKLSPEFNVSKVVGSSTIQLLTLFVICKYQIYFLY